MALDPTTEQAIRDNIASGIRRVTSSAGSTEMFSLDQQIEALEFLRADTVAKSKRLGVRIFKVRGGDALGD